MILQRIFYIAIDLELLTSLIPIDHIACDLINWASNNRTTHSTVAMLTYREGINAKKKTNFCIDKF